MKVAENEAVEQGLLTITQGTDNTMADNGQLFFIVGNAGSGKDALLSEVLLRWPASARPIHIPQRTVSRPPHDSEPYISVTPDVFEKLKRHNNFFLTWHIYGTSYGIPIAIPEWLENGHHVIVNVSRASIGQARTRIPDLKVIFVKVPFEITLIRLKSRGRELEDDPVFQQRLQRAKENQILEEADFTIDNSCSLEAAATKLLNYLLSFD